MSTTKSKTSTFSPAGADDLPDELWKTSAWLDEVLGQENTPPEKKVWASNRGRIRLSTGEKTRGRGEVVNGQATRYRIMDIGGKQYYDHELIFFAWREADRPKSKRRPTRKDDDSRCTNSAP